MMIIVCFILYNNFSHVVAHVDGSGCLISSMCYLYSMPWNCIIIKFKSMTLLSTEHNTKDVVSLGGKQFWSMKVFAIYTA